MVRRFIMDRVLLDAHRVGEIVADWQSCCELKSAWEKFLIEQLISVVAWMCAK